jgi:hypothetical protein
MLYAVYRLDTGALVSETTLPVTDLAPEYGVASFEDAEIPPRRQWDTDLRTYVSAPVNVRTRLSRLELTTRFTLTERVALKVIRNTTTDAELRATLEVLEQMQALAEFVDVTNPETIGGIQFAVQVLVGAGVVQEADAPARIAALLAPAEPL